MTSPGRGGIETGGRTTRPFLVVISGPSGVGKSSVVARLLARDPQLKLSVSLTTRAQRAGEVAGRDYTYVGGEEFAELKRAAALVESAEVHGHWYGTPRAPLERWLAAGNDVLLDIDYQGGLQVKAAFPDSVLVFLLPPSWAALEMRLRGRKSDADAEVDRRLANAAHEITHGERYDYFVVNAVLEHAVEAITAIIAAERQRCARRQADFGPLIGAPPAGGERTRGAKGSSPCSSART